AARLTGQLLGGCRVAVGDEGLCEVATAEGAELVVAAVTGAVGLRPIVAALESG
ncbi:MAG TPA: 1-deoxy-D-xylulose-5-phosphate reductoisomerase, partial [Armatimonadetes bacterium]|nr:1-deoxy-D-xylulose-5-phosphate reductoisomerase [Armatimonadota bacterium]